MKRQRNFEISWANNSVLWLLFSEKYHKFYEELFEIKPFWLDSIAVSLFVNNETAMLSNSGGLLLCSSLVMVWRKISFSPVWLKWTWAPENGFSSARIEKPRPLFHANIPPKWWSRCLFYTFTTFGRVIGKFWILNIPTTFWYFGAP